MPRTEVANAFNQHLKQKGKGKSKGKRTKDKGNAKLGSNFSKKFNLGQCTYESCAYAHRCTFKLDSGRICGEPHAAINCDKRRRTR